MNSERLVAVVGADPVRRETIVRAFTAAGFAATSAASAAELDLAAAGPPVAFVFDGFHTGSLGSQVSGVRSQWPEADVWAVAESVRLLATARGGDVVAEPAARYISCEGILQQALEELAPHGRGGISLDQRAARAEHEFERIFDASPDPVFIVCGDMVISRANKAFCAAVGRPPADVVGRHCYEIVHGLSEPWPGCMLCKVLEASGPVHWRLDDLVIPGSYDCTGFRVTLADSVVGVVHQVRELKAAGEDAEAAERLSVLGKVAASMVHELNNPLAAVVGFAEIIEDSGTCPEEFRADLRQIQYEAWRCRRIVGNLLNLARTPEPDRRPTDVNELLERAIIVRSYQPGLKKTEIVRDFASDMPLVMVDPDHIEQIALNLLTNAQEAAADSGGRARVVITTQVAGDELVVAFADNGPGISPEKVPFIFDPLYTTKRSGKGTGLGLSVSRALVEQHGGRIDVRPREAGGVVFTVRLPLIAAERPAEAVGAERRGLSPEGRVLILEDEPVVRSLLVKRLSVDGYTVVACSTPDEAVRAVESAGFDLIIADLTLLELGGDVLLPRLRERHPDLAERLVLTTGDVENLSARAARYSRNPILMKPFRSGQVRCSVESALSRRSGDDTSTKR